jgi:sarcosine oxidase subunit alpha
MTNQRRLPPHAGESLDRSRQVAFTYNGKKVVCYKGDTIASALYSTGQDIFGRSFKYHRPRGLFCVSGNCPNCFMNVDSQPNVKACTTSAKNGMIVSEQNAWPSLEHDANSIIDKFSFVLPVGFYYKRLIRPRWLWPIARSFIRRAAGYGKINPRLGRTQVYEHDHRHVDLIVIGGGPAGLCAAFEAGKGGIRVLLVDDQPLLGGHLRYKSSLCNDTKEFSNLRGHELASRLISQLDTLENVEVLSGASCFGIYEGGQVGVIWGNRLLKVRTKKVIVSTGCLERPFAFTNNDLPGILLGAGAQRLVSLYGVSPGRNILVVTNSNYGCEIVEELLDAGIKIAGVVVQSKGPRMQNSLDKIKQKGTPLYEGYVLLEAKGSRKVTGAVVSKVDAKGALVPNSTIDIVCDAMILSTGFEPANSLLYQAGGEINFDEKLNEAVPINLASWIYAAGEVTGIHDLGITMRQGRVAGLLVVKDLAVREHEPDGATTMLLEGTTKLSARIADYSRELSELTQKYRSEVHPPFLYTTPMKKEKKFACICEDVTESDIKLAIREGFDDIEPLKRYTTFTMGPCQGKMCSSTCTAVHAEAVGLKLSEAKRTTSRPPYQPLVMGLLNGPPHRPFKLTPLHRKHLELNATLMNMGEWKRPKNYGSVETEYLAIRERVGIIDVSTLGRFLVKGPDAGRFLDFVYTHIYSNLKIGKSRYALLLTETGKVLDDGIIGRLSDDEFLVTSSTGNAEAVEEWLKWWEAAGSLKLSITNLTSGLAGINVAGPKSRELLSKMVDADLSAAASPYMSCTRAVMEGIPVILLRIGFVGEIGWEIHFPAEYGEYVWERLLELGEEYDIKPVGVEAMRLLSLDKRHVWPTLDTDAASDALETDLGWAVKFEKQDFVGKHYLLKTQREGIRQKIVGVVAKESSAVENGDVIVFDGKPVGRITTAGYSFALKKYVAIAWVPVEHAKTGAKVQVLHDGDRVDTEVVSGAFYDPEGKRMRA